MPANAICARVSYAILADTSQVCLINYAAPQSNEITAVGYVSCVVIRCMLPARYRLDGACYSTSGASTNFHGRLLYQASLKLFLKIYFSFSLHLCYSQSCWYSSPASKQSIKFSSARISYLQEQILQGPYVDVKIGLY